MSDRDLTCDVNDKLWCDNVPICSQDDQAKTAATASISSQVPLPSLKELIADAYHQSKSADQLKCSLTETSSNKIDSLASQWKQHKFVATHKAKSGTVLAYAKPHQETSAPAVESVSHYLNIHDLIKSVYSAPKEELMCKVDEPRKGGIESVLGDSQLVNGALHLVKQETPTVATKTQTSNPKKILASHDGVNKKKVVSKAQTLASSTTPKSTDEQAHTSRHVRQQQQSFSSSNDSSNQDLTLSSITDGSSLGHPLTTPLNLIYGSSKKEAVIASTIPPVTGALVSSSQQPVVAPVAANTSIVSDTQEAVSPLSAAGSRILIDVSPSVVTLTVPQIKGVSERAPDEIQISDSSNNSDSHSDLEYASSTQTASLLDDGNNSSDTISVRGHEIVDNLISEKNIQNDDDSAIQATQSDVRYHVNSRSFSLNGIPVSFDPKQVSVSINPLAAIDSNSLGRQSTLDVGNLSRLRSGLFAATQMVSGSKHQGFSDGGYQGDSETKTLEIIKDAQVEYGPPEEEFVIDEGALPSLPHDAIFV